MSGADDHPYRDRSVLVTGASGFIGGHLCRRLVAAGASVHAVSRRPDDVARAVGHLVGRALAAHAVDLADAPAVAALIDAVRPAFAFHLASHVSGSRAIAEVGPTFASNLASTVHLLTGLTGGPCERLVIAGSLEETADPSAVPSSPYAAAKSAASMYARMFHALYGTPVTIARLFMVYGPGQRDARKLVPYLATSLLAGESPRLTSGVRPVDWVYVDDVVDALLACATAPELYGQTIDVGTGELTSVRGVAERVGRLVGGLAAPVFGAVEDRAAEQVRAADPRVARGLLGRPLIDVDTGLRRTVDWYRAQSNLGGQG